MQDKKSPKQLQWDERYRSDDSSETPSAALVLTENAHLLPAQGQALDLACGLGGNALFMAQRGLQVQGWDYSVNAIDRLQQFANQQGMKLQAIVRDVAKYPPEPNSFDVIVVSRFLDRTIINDLINAIVPGGLLFYQTFLQEKSDDSGPGNPEFLLKTNELISMFSEMRILVYREEGMQGDITQGFRNEALLVAQKTKDIDHQ